MVVAHPVLSKDKREDREPEAATGIYKKKAYSAKEYMVVAANPYASWVGKQIINKGGNAIDAAIAVQSMLTLVEPQSSGIGGGSFILYWDNKSKTLHAYDGRETAPSRVNIDLFLKDNKPMPWKEAVVGGRSVGVPGTLKALDMVHKQFGVLPWNELFDETIDLSAKGFTVSERLAKLVNLELHPGLRKFRTSSVYFYPEGQGLKAGQVKKNSALARTLTTIAKEGADSFYKGNIADKIVKAVEFASINPGFLRTDDMAAYEAVKRRPVCGKYKKHQICGMPPPSSGGFNILQILKLLEPYNLAQYPANSVLASHLFTQASRLAYADRDMYVADTDFSHLPFSAMLSERYLQDRGSKIRLDKDMGRAQAGKPFPHMNFASTQDYDLPSTSHFSIIDKQGNAISITSSIEFAFGSGLMVEGFLLNNQLTDFSFNPYKSRA
jgi:gamma-glutamyltranspeptidase/glutathione hydrolase